MPTRTLPRTRSASSLNGRAEVSASVLRPRRNPAYIVAGALLVGGAVAGVHVDPAALGPVGAGAGDGAGGACGSAHHGRRPAGGDGGAGPERGAGGRVAGADTGGAHGGGAV